MKAETATMTTDLVDQDSERGDEEADSQEWYESDLQLAAELGKTLLERNQELEENLRQHQIIIEEQANEIEYLTRQSSALREVNDSRLKVYEQLEVSITELEKTNQKLQQENTTDKKRIKSLYNSIDTLEKKCEELQELVDDMRTTESQKNCKYRPNSSPPELRRVLSLDCGLIESNFVGNETNPLDKEVAKLKTTVSKLKCQVEKERQKREELELEISNILQENASLQQQIYELREDNEKHPNLEDECIESGESLCRHCIQEPHSSGSSVPTVLVNEAETEDPLQMGECTVVQLHNGGLAYGSQTSLQTAGLPVIEENSSLESTESRNGVSLFSELDDQYKRLIQKYESLLGNRNNEAISEDRQLDSVNISKDSSIVSNCTGESNDSDSHCEISSSPSLSESAEHSKVCSDDLSEAIDSSLSSGFSDMSDHITADKEVQTDPVEEDKNNVVSNCKTLSLSSASATLEGHFNHGPPEYKRLFQEIFAVLKRSLHSDESDRPIGKEQDANQETSGAERNCGFSRNGHFKHCEQPQRWAHLAQQQDKGFNFGNVDWARLESAKVANASNRVHLPGSMTYAEVLVKGQRRPAVKVSSRSKFPVKP